MKLSQGQTKTLKSWCKCNYSDIIVALMNNCCAFSSCANVKATVVASAWFSSGIMCQASRQVTGSRQQGHYTKAGSDVHHVTFAANIKARQRMLVVLMTSHCWYSSSGHCIEGASISLVSNRGSEV